MSWILGILKALLTGFNLWQERAKDKTLIEAGKALQLKEEIDHEKKLEQDIADKQSRLTDADVDELLKPPSERGKL